MSGMLFWKVLQMLLAVTEFRTARAAPGLLAICLRLSAIYAMVRLWFTHLTVFEVMAMFAERDTVLHIIPQIRMARPWLDVVRYQAIGVLAAFLADVMVTHKYCLAPVSVLLSAHRSTARPSVSLVVRVILAALVPRSVAPLRIIRPALDSLFPPRPLRWVFHLLPEPVTSASTVLRGVLRRFGLGRVNGASRFNGLALLQRRREVLVALWRYCGALNRAVLDRVPLLDAPIIVTEPQAICLTADSANQINVHSLPACIAATPRTVLSVALSYLSIVRQEVLAARLALPLDGIMCHRVT